MWECENVRMHRSGQERERRKSGFTALLWQRPGGLSIYVHRSMSSVSLHFLTTRAVIAVLVDISRVNVFTS